VLANDAVGCSQFVIRQQRERTVAVVECAEPVGNTDHAVRGNAVRFQIDRITDGQDGFGYHAGLGAKQIWRL
jgi:hypothetical protein